MWVRRTGYPYRVLRQHDADIVLGIGLCLLQHQERTLQVLSGGIVTVDAAQVSVYHHNAVDNGFGNKAVRMSVRVNMSAAVTCGHPCRNRVYTVGEDAQLRTLIEL